MGDGGVLITSAAAQKFKLRHYLILRGMENLGPICYAELKGLKSTAMGVAAMPTE
jgi:hypothetical protein